MKEPVLRRVPPGDKWMDYNDQNEEVFPLFRFFISTHYSSPYKENVFGGGGAFGGSGLTTKTTPALASIWNSV